MKNGQHLYFFSITIHYINHPVIAVEHFPDGFIVDFGHPPPQIRKMLKRAEFRYHVFFEDFRKLNRTYTLVIFNDRIQFLLGLRRKSDVCHRVLLGLFGLTALLQACFYLIKRHGISFLYLFKAHFNLV